MIKRDLDLSESIDENLNTWCYEVGSRFEQIGIDAAKEFVDMWRFINKIEKYYGLTNKDFYVTDLGCGDGASSNYLADQGFKVTSVDINKEKLNKMTHELIEKVHTDMEDYLYSQEDYSVQNIFTHHSLEHTVDAEEIIKLCGQKLKSGGLYYATVPADDYLHSVHHVVFEDQLELLPYGLELLLAAKRERFGESEFVCIAKQP